MDHSVVYSTVSGVSEKLCLITRPDSFVETNEFQIPGSEVVVKMRPAKNVHVSGSLVAQFVLVELAMTSLELTCLRQVVAICRSYFRSNANSLVYGERHVETKLTEGTTARSALFTIKCDSQWKHEFMNLNPPDPADLTISVDDKRIPTTEAILTSKSDVFAAMFAYDTIERQSRTVEIKDFSFEVVQEMIRFMIHDYCTLGDGQMEALTSIAEKYNTIGMKKLADEKRLLLVEPAESPIDVPSGFAYQSLHPKAFRAKRISSKISSLIPRLPFN